MQATGKVNKIGEITSAHGKKFKKAIKIKYILAHRVVTCSQKFLGTKLKTVYLVVETALVASVMSLKVGFSTSVFGG